MISAIIIEQTAKGVYDESHNCPIIDVMSVLCHKSLAHAETAAACSICMMKVIE